MLMSFYLLAERLGGDAPVPPPARGAPAPGPEGPRGGVDAEQRRCRVRGEALLRSAQVRAHDDRA